MKRWKGWLSNFKNSFFLSSKSLLFKVISRLRHKTKESRGGMVSLYKDMEACAGYADIQVMKEMVHSASLPTNHNTEIRKMPFLHKDLSSSQLKS